MRRDLVEVLDDLELVRDRDRRSSKVGRANRRQNVLADRRTFDDAVVMGETEGLEAGVVEERGLGVGDGSAEEVELLRWKAADEVKTGVDLCEDRKSVV